MVGRTNFEIGTRVECVSPGEFSELKKGGIYIIAEQIPNGLLRIEGVYKYLSPLRFRHAPKQSLLELWRSVQDDG